MLRPQNPETFLNWLVHVFDLSTQKGYNYRGKRNKARKK